MEKRSTHWADVLSWLQTVTDSCQTREQANNCERLIRNYQRMYESKVGLSKVWDLTREMERKLWDIGFMNHEEKIKKLIE